MSHPLKELLESDPRYPIEAYEFVRDSLSFAQANMGLGKPPSDEKAQEDEDQPERHLTGQELCEASRRHALEQYGMMAKVVLGNWGIHSTSDLGEIVYNLIRVELMKKSHRDQRKDFDEVFDFQVAFRDQYEFSSQCASENLESE